MSGLGRTAECGGDGRVRGLDARLCRPERRRLQLVAADGRLVQGRPRQSGPHPPHRSRPSPVAPAHLRAMWLQEKNGKTYADKQVKMDLRGAVLSYQAAMRFANSYATTPYIRRVCGCGCASAAPDTRACAGRRLSGSCRSRLGRRAPKEAEQVLPGANATLLYAAPRSASQCSLRLDTSPLVPSGVAAFALRAALPCQSYDSTKSYTSTYDSLTTVIF